VAPQSLVSAYRREGDHTLIEIRVREIRQLFHTLDPAPFRPPSPQDVETLRVAALERQT
jgi:hypothetical protein